MKDGVAYAYAMPEEADRAAAKHLKVDVNIVRTAAFTGQMFHPYDVDSPEVKRIFVMQ